ncbi:hypothetical protein BDF21DRAFT_463162 [Thamnidium elegans]|nr:hypothetical protein BDF21DRAFT_463162 [Thamnidium elegans]
MLDYDLPAVTTDAFDYDNDNEYEYNGDVIMEESNVEDNFEDMTSTSDTPPSFFKTVF